MVQASNIIYHSIDKVDLRDAVAWLNEQGIYIQKFYWENEDIIEKAEERAFDTEETISEVILEWANSFRDLVADRAMVDNFINC